jgi:hypothetical protein
MRFDDTLSEALQRNRITRRQVLWLLGAGALSGCAASPTGGGAILVGMDEDEEKAVDRQVAPQQFSQDLGAVQDEALNAYVAEVGSRLDAKSHRPQMPYSYRVLNANYVNAYTFPGGAMGVTRGIVADLHDEAELAALLGHELGHVNARHAAQRKGQALVAQVAVSGANLIAAGSGFGSLVDLGGQLGASALLSSYSRDNEREADALGQAYMVRAGYPASGMVGLQQLLVDQKRNRRACCRHVLDPPDESRTRDTARQLAVPVRASNGRDKGVSASWTIPPRCAVSSRPSPPSESGAGHVAQGLRQGGRGFRTALRATPRDYAPTSARQVPVGPGQGCAAAGVRPGSDHHLSAEAQAQKLVGVLARPKGSGAAL